ncbi:MAG TPA: sugar ABC transporter ATP-binding protein [Solirubrobacterales bacterium]|nr:sugar ABC transporter ATP-binding protein [Solirubrobacterales bacterium]
MSGAALRLRGVRKRFGPTVALDGVDLDVAAGELLGIAGPNGAGKSTLARIISGEAVADEGRSTYGDRPLDPVESVAIVHQDPQLFPNLSVAQNLLVGREGRKARWPRVESRGKELLQHLDLDRYATTPVEQCPLAIQQRVEIARALSGEVGIFLFDEPNSALTERESAELFHEMRRLAAGGAVVILVSHRLHDLVEHCDRVVMVRGGKVRETFAGESLTEDAIARALVHDAAVPARAERAPASAAATTVLEVESWSSPAGDFTDIDLSLTAGTVTALTGVEGSGARELLRSLGGLEPARGTYRIDGAEEAPGRGSAFVPASRRDSLFDNFDVGQNLVVRRAEEITARGVIRKRHMRRLAGEEVRRYGVKTAGAGEGIRALSGGNQQKVAIAAAIAARPRLLLLEEPTRGVDLGSRNEIYGLLWGLAESGCAVLIFCTETTEVFDAAARVHVVSRGRLLAPIDVVHQDVEALATELTSLELSDKAPAG